MNYAIIAGVIFAWAVCFGWAVVEYKHQRRMQKMRDYLRYGCAVGTGFLHNAINVDVSGEQYQSGSLKADWYLDKNPVGTYYEEP